MGTWWRPIVHNLIGRRACVSVAVDAAADAKQMRAISAGGAGSIRPDIKLNCRTEERAAGEQCDQVIIMFFALVSTPLRLCHGYVSAAASSLP